jgi:hypothetical protein
MQNTSLSHREIPVEDIATEDSAADLQASY